MAIGKTPDPVDGPAFFVPANIDYDVMAPAEAKDAWGGGLAERVVAQADVWSAYWDTPTKGRRTAQNPSIAVRAG